MNRPLATIREVVEAGWVGDTATIDAAADSPDPDVRAAVVSGWQRCGVLDDARLTRALNDPGPTVRRRAAECAAAAPPGPTVVAALVSATSDPDAEVVDAACFALGEIGHVEPGVVAAIEAVATGHSDPLCRESAVAALGALGDPSSREVVLAACRDKATIRRRAVLALAAFDGPDVSAMLEELLSDRDWQVRQAAEDLTAPPVD